MNLPDISTNRYVGIVLVSRKGMEGVVDPERAKMRAGYDVVDAKIWDWITDDTRIARHSRSEMLISNKLRGVVRDIPPITNYDSALKCSREGFDPAKLPFCGFTFAGAIWSAPPQNAFPAP